MGVVHKMGNRAHDEQKSLLRSTTFRKGLPTGIALSTEHRPKAAAQKDLRGYR
jgi:hypothetical protein